jgi:hypothetical protein
MRTAELRGEPLSEIQPEVRKEWLETLDRSLSALATMGVGLVGAMKTLQSETSDIPVNLTVPGVGPSVLNLAAEHNQ